MGNVLSHIVLLASQNRFLAYLVFYFSTIFIGNISAFAGFWIIFRGSFGAFGIPLLIATIFAADLSGDLLWYSLGRVLRNTSFGNFVKDRLPRYEKLERRMNRNGAKWVLFAKFIYASSFPVIFLIGWSGVDFKRFLKMSLVSICIWVPILTGLSFGLIAGLSPLGAASAFREFEIVFLAGLVLFFAIDYLIAKLFGRLFEKIAAGEEAAEDAPLTPPQA